MKIRCVILLVAFIVGACFIPLSSTSDGDHLLPSTILIAAAMFVSSFILVILNKRKHGAARIEAPSWNCTWFRNDNLLQHEFDKAIGSLSMGMGGLIFSLYENTRLSVYAAYLIFGGIAILANIALQLRLSRR